MGLHASVLDEAYRIAVKELRSCYDDYGVVAGRGHYEDYWTRDATFAWLGALELGDFEVVENHLRFLTFFQRDDGMISFLVRKYLPLLSAIGVKIERELKPKFRGHKSFYLSEVVDSNPSFVIGFSEFLGRMGERDLLVEFLPNLEAALSWCLGRIRPGDVLASEGLLAGWNDGVYKIGRTLLTNVLFCRAFMAWEAICRDYHLELRPEFFGVAEGIREALHREFFNGAYFIDWIGRRRNDFFDSNANLLAVLWDVATRTQAESIVGFALDRLDGGPLLGLVYPPYPRSRLDLFNRIAGLGGYTSGDGMYWSEPVSLLALCLDKIGRRDEAREVLVGLAELIVKHEGVYEVYEWDRATAQSAEANLGPRPVRRLLYHAEHPFARGAGLFVFAYNSLN